MASFSSAGSGRKRGPTLLETHNENSAAITNEARKGESLDKINWIMKTKKILPERISKGILLEVTLFAVSIPTEFPTALPLKGFSDRPDHLHAQLP